MKYIKLILIIAVIAGLIYGAFCIIGPNSSTTIINPDSPTLLNDLKKKVDNDWENASTWNQDVYDKNISDANAYHKDLDKISAGNYITLIDYTNEKVCNKLIEFINTEFAKSNCSEYIISHMKIDIDYFIKKNGTISASDSRISNAYKKISLYHKILAFGRESFDLSPEFDLTDDTWTDFARHHERQLKKRDDFKKDGNYSSLSHITDIKTSLSSVENKLDKARNRFEQKLSNEIISAYSTEPRSEFNQQKLHNVYINYYKSYNDGNKLSAFRKQFNIEVDEESGLKKRKYKELQW